MSNSQQLELPAWKVILIEQISKFTETQAWGIGKL